MSRRNIHISFYIYTLLTCSSTPWAFRSGTFLLLLSKLWSSYYHILSKFNVIFWYFILSIYEFWHYMLSVFLYFVTKLRMLFLFFGNSVSLLSIFCHIAVFCHYFVIFLCLIMTLSCSSFSSNLATIFYLFNSL